MSNNNLFNKIKSYYDSGLWNEARVRNMVIRGIITEEQYKEITGNDYNK